MWVWDSAKHNGTRGGTPHGHQVGSRVTPTPLLGGRGVQRDDFLHDSGVRRD